jgi:hypothetical protein
MGASSEMTYFVLQQGLDGSRLSRLARELSLRRWAYLGEDGAWRVEAEAVMPSQVSIIRTGNLLESESNRLRQPFIDWIGSLSQQNNQVEWWASELAAKNPSYGLFTRVCFASIGQKLLETGLEPGTLLVCSRQSLLDEVVRYARANRQASVILGTQQNPAAPWRIARHYARAGARKLRQTYSEVLGRTGQGKGNNLFSDRQSVLTEIGLSKVPSFSGPGTVLLFTWADERNVSSDGRFQYKDPHLGPLSGLLRERGFRVGFVPRVLPGTSFDEVARKLVKTGEMMLFPELWVSDSEWSECWDRARRFSPRIPVDSSVGGVRAHGMAYEHLKETIGSLANNLWYEKLITNFSRSGIHPWQIIHTCEGHAWEQVLAWSVKKYMPDVRVIGYENGVLEKMRLGMYPARSELGLRPLPDRIVTNGPMAKGVLVAGGVPRERVAIGCGLRHTYLWNLPVNGRSEARVAQGNATRVLVATSISFPESVELVGAATDAFGGDPRFEVSVKCHPVVDAKAVADKIPRIRTISNVRFVTEPVQELLSRADVLLYTHTYVCYEALLYGVPPVFVGLENSLSRDKLEPAPEVRWAANTSEGLRKVVDCVTRMPEDERDEWQSRAREVVRAALAPVTQEAVEAFVFQ